MHPARLHNTQARKHQYLEIDTRQKTTSKSNREGKSAKKENRKKIDDELRHFQERKKIVKKTRREKRLAQATAHERLTSNEKNCIGACIERVKSFQCVHAMPFVKRFMCMYTQLIAHTNTWSGRCKARKMRLFLVWRALY